MLFKHLRVWSRVCVCIALLAGSSALAEPDRGALQAYLGFASQELPAPARAALDEMNGAARQLLAVRSYLRAGDNLEQRWSWSQERIAAFERSREYEALVAAVERVRTRFEQQNPGYTLYANAQTRSLDQQLKRWNENGGVARVAQSLERDALRELQAQNYPAAPSPEHVQRFAQFLRQWRPPSAAPLAAPGLSMHGQSRAIDFQVMRGRRVVASADMGSVRNAWERQGWARKLQLAMDEAAFVGPLKSPNEPWHYEYVRARDRMAADAR